MSGQDTVSHVLQLSHAPTTASGHSSPQPLDNTLRTDVTQDLALDGLSASAVNTPSATSVDNVSRVTISKHFCTPRSLLRNHFLHMPCSSDKCRQLDQLAILYDSVTHTGKYNFQQARLPVPSELNIAVWRKHLLDYHDVIVCEFLEFGWPVNYVAPYPPMPALSNHTSAIAFPAAMTEYINTESIQHKALIGPFSGVPFTSFQTSPLMSRPRKDPSKRRIILDLSFPDRSVNDGIPSDVYLGVPYKLRLPTVDDLVALIQVHGPGSYIYGHDLHRAYRQWRTDPTDWPLLGMHWNGSFYFDTAIPFGLRWGAMACQRASKAICHIMSNTFHSTTLAYIDDFAGISTTYDVAVEGFSRLRTLLHELGVQESVEKSTEPTTIFTWIGIVFDTTKMQIRMPEDKIKDTIAILSVWAEKQTATRLQLQQLLGKLFHIAKCVKPARLFVGRMLDTLRNSTHHTHSVRLSDEFQKDIAWFRRFMPDYNGIHLIKCAMPHIQVHVDSCLTGCGGFWHTHYYHGEFPKCIINAQYPICYLEMLNVLVALRIWGHMWNDKQVLLFCDNSTTVAVLSNGRSRDAFLLSCARHIWLITVTCRIALTVRHKPGTEMDTADCLSRAHLSHTFTAKLASIFEANTSQRYAISDQLYILDSDI